MIATCNTVAHSVVRSPSQTFESGRPRLQLLANCLRSLYVQSDKQTDRKIQLPNTMSVRYSWLASESTYTPRIYIAERNGQRKRQGARPPYNEYSQPACSAISTTPAACFSSSFYDRHAIVVASTSVRK